MMTARLRFHSDRFATRLHLYRWQHQRQTLRALAADMGMSASTLSRLECGGTPDLETFMTLCVRMHEDPANFFYEETCEER